ncbi:MAG: hypothetical protein LBT16_07290 [Treponema sp.]|jgi:hypothetical protein|nr:hypothetical protein [Treponema sp.]
MNEILKKRKFPLRIILPLLISVLYISGAAGFVKLHILLASVSSIEDSIAAFDILDAAAVEVLSERLETMESSAALMEDGEGGGDKREQIPPRDINESVSGIRNLLRENGIPSERLRFSGKSGDEFAEFVLRCELFKYFNFLAQITGTTAGIGEALIRPAVYSGSMNYLSIKTIRNSAEADITMRFQHENYRPK